MATPIRIHPDNPKLFEFRDKPLVLLTATEHYGAVFNRPFDFARYLADTADKKITLSRLFILFRELQSPNNPYSTCKPESPDYIAPHKRIGPQRALDGEPQYDLDQWNPEFFERLHSFVAQASDYGIIIEIVLLSNTYGEHIWALNPLNAANNINGTEHIPWYQYMSQNPARIYQRQVQLTRRIVAELNPYDNIIWEICNEPGGGVGADDAPAPERVNDWLESLNNLIRQTEAELPKQHIIAGQEAFAYKLPEESHNPLDVHQFSDRSFDSQEYEVVNMHPLSNMKHRGKQYNLGRFMQAQLNLEAYRQYCLDLYPEAKPLNLDEDNCASQYKDLHGWTIHRKRAWMALLCGAHYDVIDFSINNYLETGTPQSQRHIRNWMRHLSEYVHALDLVHSRPMPMLVRQNPKHALAVVFGVPCKDYSAYLADHREAGDPSAGERVEGELVIDLPKGDYKAACFSPQTGLYSPRTLHSGGPKTVFALPPFNHDIVLRLQRLG
jgi:hypothetical protein